MAKRTFSEISGNSTASEAASEILRHAEDLLRAAQKLKKDMDAGKEADCTDLSDISQKLTPAVNSLSDTIRKPQKVPKVKDEDAEPGVSVPSTTLLTAWTSNDITGTVPPIPPILDSVLEQAAFTHSGTVLRPGEEDYERLEWLGDAYLELIASCFIYQTFPVLTAGRCSQYRETLVKNKTLAKFATEYGLHHKLKLPVELAVNSKDREKIYGDVFESYVAGAILGDPQGLERVSTWLKALWSKRLAPEIEREFKRQEKAPTSAILPAKVQLSQALGGKGIKIEYRDDGIGKENNSGLPWYKVAVYLNGWGVSGLRLGVGGALSKKEAGEKAAEAALCNKKLLEPLKAKRMEFYKAIEAQKELACFADEY